jgi:hypothetical protein
MNRLEGEVIAAADRFAVDHSELSRLRRTNLAKGALAPLFNTEEYIDSIIFKASSMAVTLLENSGEFGAANELHNDCKELAKKRDISIEDIRDYVMVYLEEEYPEIYGLYQPSYEASFKDSPA